MRAFTVNEAAWVYEAMAQSDSTKRSGAAQQSMGLLAWPLTYLSQRFLIIKHLYVLELLS